MLCLSDEAKSKLGPFIFAPLLSVRQARVNLIHLHHQHSPFKKLHGEPHPAKKKSICSIRPGSKYPCEEDFNSHLAHHLAHRLALIHFSHVFITD